MAGNTVTPNTNPNVQIAAHLPVSEQVKQLASQLGNATLENMLLKAPQKSYLISKAFDTHNLHAKQVQTGGNTYHTVRTVHGKTIQHRFGPESIEQVQANADTIYYVDILNAFDELEEVRRLTRDELDEFMDEPKRAITAASWIEPESPQHPTMIGYNEFPVDTSDSEDPVETIDALLKEHGIDEWEGRVTWDVGPGRSVYVERSTLTWQTVGLTRRPHRTFMLVETEGPYTRIHKAVDVNGLRKQLAKGSNITIRQPVYAPEAPDPLTEEARESQIIEMIERQSEDVVKTDVEEQYAQNPNPDPAIVHAIKLSQVAIWMLSGADSVISDDKASKQLRTRLLNQYKTAAMQPLSLWQSVHPPQENVRCQTLMAVMDHYGVGHTFKVAVDIQHRFKSVMEKLGIPITNGDASVSWIAEGIADQIHLSTNRLHAAPEVTTGLDFSDPLDGTKDAGNRQKDIVNLRLGSTYLSELVKATPSPKPTGKIVNGQPSYIDNIEYHFDELPLRKIQKPYRDELTALALKLRDRLAAGEEPYNHEIIRIGQLLQLSVSE